jgi:arylsulfatase A-like enzyme
MNKILIILSFLIFSGCNHISKHNKTEFPNIFLITVDDLGWRDLGIMGSQYYETPFIDNLASQSMIFTNAYAGAANCAPSRASLFSGLNTPKHGVYTVGSSENPLSQLVMHQRTLRNSLLAMVLKLNIENLLVVTFEDKND